MKKIAIMIACLSIITSMVSCSKETTANERTMPTNTTSQMITGEVSVIGKVSEIYGNEVTIILAENDTSTTRPNVGGGATGEGTTTRPDMANMTDEEKAEMMANRGEGATGAGNMADMTDEEKAEMMANRGEGATGAGNMVDMTDEEKAEMMANRGEGATGAGNMADMTDEDKAAMREDMANMSEEDMAAMKENMMSNRGEGATGGGGRGQSTQQPVEVDEDTTESTEEDEDEDEVTTSSNKATENTDSNIGTTATKVTSNLGSSLVNTMSINFANTTLIANGGGGGRGDMSDADREAMMETMGSGGDRTSMMGNSTTSTDDIVLTNETALYTIPVGVPVYSMGTALSFSQISKDAYIQIYMNNSGNIVSVNILG